MAGRVDCQEGCPGYFTARQVTSVGEDVKSSPQYPPCEPPRLEVSAVAWVAAGVNPAFRQPLSN